MTDAWNKLITYSEGERCRFFGETFEAKFDLVRGLKPIGPLSSKFWRRVSTVHVPKAKTAQPSGSPSRKQPTGYLTRAVGFR
ncbi:hypothetical protein ACFSQT_11975 [Mesorhizobium calcicola]|uniref:Uncharacterized protein n=1 Tax=Mesorhizobium calcicola TaxID=1300310 RepID=A0ABW4WC52_9HYPH